MSDSADLQKEINQLKKTVEGKKADLSGKLADPSENVFPKNGSPLGGQPKVRRVLKGHFGKVCRKRKGWGRGGIEGKRGENEKEREELIGGAPPSSLFVVQQRMYFASDYEDGVPATRLEASVVE